ncbi:hypothetical protein GH714_034904 [Hevea brasiliensis]|uniref:Homeobox domain-containing protein n=1 Tax=Hevea brasiliensis TaxID=3981 RepID=A0A6A6MHU2_HEVBR|nr:hypothetical protein GH714_034904 [Hevea brasiliensis]
MDDARLRIQCMATSLVGQELMVRNQMKLWNQKSSKYDEEISDEQVSFGNLANFFVVCYGCDSCVFDIRCRCHFITKSGRRGGLRHLLQLQILERIFDMGNGTPSKQKIKEITTKLSQHGQISESNVYNWFQNRRARSKRKQLVASSNNAESEVETEVDSLNEKTKPEIFHSQQSHPRPDDLCFQSTEINSELHFLGVLPNQRDDHLPGKMEVLGSYIHYDQAEDYGMAG